ERGLRQVRHLPRELPPRPLGDGLFVPADLAAPVQRADQRLDQRALAAAVGPDQRDHLASEQVHVHRAQRLDLAVGEAEVDGLEQAAHGRPSASSARLRDWINSSRKNGPPRRLVSTPTGKSVSPAPASRRDAASALASKAAPNAVASGSTRRWSVPTSSRATCGQINPMK